MSRAQWSMRAKLVLAFIMVIVPIVLLASNLVQVDIANYRSQRTLEHTALANQVAGEMDTSLETLLQALRAAASAMAILPPAGPERQTVLHTVRSTYPMLSTVQYLRAGTGAAGALEPPVQRLVQRLEAGATDTPAAVAVPGAGTWTIALVAPGFLPGGQLDGNLVVAVPLQTLWNSLRLQEGGGRRDAVALIDAQGQVVIQSGQFAGDQVGELRTPPIQTNSYRNLGQMLVVRSSATGSETAWLSVTSPPLQMLPWRVLAGRTQSEDVRVVGAKLLRALLVEALITALAVAVGIFTAKRITQPLQEILQATERITAGEFNQPVIIRSHDELHLVGSAINHMMSTIKLNIAELAEAKQELAGRTRNLQALLRSRFDAQEAERARIASELHDGAVQQIVAAHYEIESLRRHVRESSPEAGERIDHIQRVLDQCIRETRAIVYDLRPPTLAYLGLVPAVERLVQEQERVFGIKGYVETVHEARRLGPDRELGVFRIVQEALQNVQRHARASEVVVWFQFGVSDLSVTVRDNGKGFSYSSLRHLPGSHLGILNMRERAENLGGYFSVDSTPGAGTTVVAVIPHGNEEPETVTGMEDPFRQPKVLTERGEKR